MSAPARRTFSCMPGIRRPSRGGVLAGALVACAMSAPAGGCIARDEPPPEFETRLVLRDDLRREARAFRSGEAITFVVTLRNRAGAPRSLTLPTSQTHDVVIEGGDRREIWRHSAGRMFAQVLTELKLGKDETRAFTVIWKQLDSTGRPVPPGDYRAVGLVPARVPGCRSEAVSFTIEPAGGTEPRADPPPG